ncbi:hypothetical protein [Pantoea anthophila]|uniref:hypothetical protein n=1 Tax=Pantoea anthophila TaxID=470931 RepID=UPI00301BEC2C
MARATPPYIPESPACLAAHLREIADMLESRSPFIRSIERYYASGEAGKQLSVIHIEMLTEPD